MRIIVSIALCLAILAGGGGIIFAALTLRPATENADAAQVRPATNIRVQVLEATGIDDALELTGRTFAWSEVEVSAETSGIVEWEDVERGEIIEEGAEIFRIDTTNYKRDHAQAQSRFDLAKQELDRLKRLRERGIASPQDIDRANNEFTLARADLAAAETQLRRSVIYAPIGGTIDLVHQDKGEFVDVGTPLVRIVQTDPVSVGIPLPERDLEYFKLGDVVRFALDALPGREFQGPIFRISTSADVATRTFGLEVYVENKEGLLRPGMTVRAHMVRQRFEDAITVPVFAVLAMETQRFAVVEEEGFARFRPIQTGRIIGDQVHVTEGLAPGDRLIVSGQREIRDGEAVNVLSGTEQ